jgi:putative membrane protein
MPYHMTDWVSGYHMMGWFMGPWMIGIWLIFLVIAYLVYKDAETRGMNGVLWFVLVVLPWIGIIFLIAYLIIREQKQLPSGGRTPAEILEERYAKGEITREEYLRMKEDLKK